MVEGVEGGGGEEVSLYFILHLAAKILYLCQSSLLIFKMKHCREIKIFTTQFLKILRNKKKNIKSGGGICYFIRSDYNTKPVKRLLKVCQKSSHFCTCQANRCFRLSFFLFFFITHLFLKKITIKQFCFINACINDCKIV